MGNSPPPHLIFRVFHNTFHWRSQPSLFLVGDGGGACQLFDTSDMKIRAKTPSPPPKKNEKLKKEWPFLIYIFILLDRHFLVFLNVPTYLLIELRCDIWILGRNFWNLEPKNAKVHLSGPASDSLQHAAMK